MNYQESREYLNKKLRGQFRRLSKVVQRAQVENSEEKNEKMKELESLTKGTPEWEKLHFKIKNIRTISDGTRKTYIDVGKSVLRRAYEKWEIRYFKHITPEKSKELIQEKIDNGESAQNIRKVIHALDYIQRHAKKTRVFKKGQIKFTNHPEMLEMIKKQKVIRRSKDSRRYSATKDECLRVIKEMKKSNSYLADIAKYQLLSGFRVSEAIRQTKDNVDLENNRHYAHNAKGGLNNVVSTNHHIKSEKEFLEVLMNKENKDNGRLFERMRDKKTGAHLSDEQVRLRLTSLATRCAERLDIRGINGEKFSSHSFRGAFAHDRMCSYVKNKEKLDEIIADKIREQPRLSEKYKAFEKIIRNKVIKSNRHKRIIQEYEKVQWLVSTDLNHSRQDIVRYYVSSDEIQAEINRNT